MSGFDDFAGKLNAEHKAKAQDFQERQAREREERHNGWRQEIALMETSATPILAEAVRACEKLGLRPVIVKNWERDLFMNPAMEFQLFGPKQRPHDASTYEIEANKVIVRVEDGKLRAQVSKRAYASKAGADYVGYGPEGVEQAVKHSIESYYDEISPDRG